MTITAGVVSDWVLEVAAWSETEPTTYTQVFGIQEFTPPGVSKNLEDDSDFDSDGWASQMATGLEYEITGTVKVPRAALTPDPGQEIMRTAGEGLAEDGRIHWRAYKRGGTTGRQGVAECTFTEGGGKRTDLTTAEFTLAGVGKLEPYTVAPAA
jgi:hypothetical protein